MKWQPIETAPKDGEILLIWIGDVDFGYCRNGKWFVINNGDYLYGGHGRDYACGVHDSFVYRPPTHWMPLPEAPKE